MRPNEMVPDSLKKLMPQEVKDVYWALIQTSEQYNEYKKSRVDEKDIIAYLNQLDDILEIPKITFLDIGARFGSHLDTPLQRSKIKIEYIGIEPGEDECRKLTEENPEDVFYPIALGEEEEEKSLNITQHKGCSSILRPNQQFIKNFPWIEEWFRVESNIDIKTTTLDKLCQGEIIVPDLIKSDTQGYEHQIFDGSKETIKQAVLLEFEAHFKQLYEGQKLFGDIDILLRDEGFELIDLTDVNRWNEKARLPFYRNTAEPFNTEIVEADPLYRKKLDNLNEMQEKKLYALLINYGKFDIAKRIARKSKQDFSQNVEELLK